VAEIIEHVAKTDRVTLDTGDGVALCFLGDPEDALVAATALRDRLHTQQGESRLRLRVGINIGPVRVVKDIAMLS
jgi:class 3 adenylate cyclase